jgi:N-acetylmuramoyl-L-alanine amidase
MEILVAAGHSMSDPGAVNGKWTEAKLATELRDLVAAEIRKLTTGSLTIVKEDGEDGENWPLSESIKLARGRHAFEIHFNSVENKAATGVECIGKLDKKWVCQKISNGIAAALGIKTRGELGWIDTSKSQHSRLGFVNANGVIIEVCFMSNNNELAKYLANKKAVAAAIALAIVAVSR